MSHLAGTHFLASFGQTCIGIDTPEAQAGGAGVAERVSEPQEHGIKPD